MSAARDSSPRQPTVKCKVSAKDAQASRPLADQPVPMTHLQLIFGRLVVGALDLRRSSSRQEGQALIEYALIISLIAVLAIAALQLTGTNIKSLLNKIAGEV